MNREEGGGSGGINGDLVIEILIRLPAIHIIQLKLVCKEWLSIISSKQFRLLHTLRHPTPPPSSLILQVLFPRPVGRLFYIMSPPFPVIMPRHKFPFPSPRIKSTCNGLILLSSVHRYRVDYYVHNITTNESRRIDIDDSSQYEYRLVMGYHIAFDPSKSIHYSIVIVRADRENLQRCRVDVYDSESCSWKIMLPFRVDNIPDFSYGVYCNGSIYWQGRREIWYYDIGKRNIASLSTVDRVQVLNGHLYCQWEKKLLECRKQIDSKNIFMLSHTLAPV